MSCCFFFRLLMLYAGLLVGNTSPVEQWTAQWSYGISSGTEILTRHATMRMEWESRHWNGRGSELGEQLLFADFEGHVGAFDNVYPHETTTTNQITDKTVGSSSPVTNNDDPLVDDRLLMEVSKLL